MEQAQRLLLQRAKVSTTTWTKCLLDDDKPYDVVVDFVFHDAVVADVADDVVDNVVDVIVDNVCSLRRS